MSGVALFFDIEVGVNECCKFVIFPFIRKSEADFLCGIHTFGGTHYWGKIGVSCHQNYNITGIIVQ